MPIFSYEYTLNGQAGNEKTGITKFMSSSMGNDDDSLLKRGLLNATRGIPQNRLTQPFLVVVSSEKAAVYSVHQSCLLRKYM